MIIRKLSSSEIADIYNKHVVNDFPKSEVKPLGKILNGVAEGKYFVYGYIRECMEGNESAGVNACAEGNGSAGVNECADGLDGLVGYAFFIKSSVTDTYLLDYFAVVAGKRSCGIGSSFLQELKSTVANKGGHLILEVENPDCEPAGAARDYMIKRIGFYQKNGMNVSGVSCRFCGNEYKILYAGEQTTDEAIRSETEAVYLDFFGKDFIEKNCRFESCTFDR